MRNLTSQRVIWGIILLGLMFSIAEISMVSAFYWNDGTLIGYWNMSSQTASVNDSSYHLYNYSASYPTFTNNGIIGQASYHNGNNNNAWGVVNQTTEMALTQDGLNFTISLWINFSRMPLSQTPIATNGWWTVVNTDYNRLMCGGFGSAQFSSSTGILSNNMWYYVVITKNASSVCIWINGTLDTCTARTGNANAGGIGLIIGDRGDGIPFNGTIDEVGIWRRILTPIEIIKLYNSGKGLGYNQTIVSVSLNSPLNNSFLDYHYSFNASYSSEVTFSNASYNLWYKNGTLYNQTIISIPNNNLTSLNFILPNNNFKWNVYACNIWNTCNWNNENKTFGAIFVENSQTFNSPTTAGNTEIFRLNMTYDSSSYNINSYLIYNNTAYIGTKTGTGNNILYSKTLTMPHVTAEVNNSFYWQIGLINSTATNYYNSSWQNQTVRDLGGIGICTDYTTLVLNYTLRDERTQNIMNGTYLNSTIEVDLQIYPSSSDILIMNFSKLYNSTYNAAICFNVTLINSSQYRLYSQVRYGADGYVYKSNYLQNFTLQNSTIPQNIKLFDLQSIYGTQFLTTYKDSTFLSVPDALISINKKYVSEGLFKTVEIVKTDSSGQATNWFDLNGYQYQMIVSKEGNLLSTFDNIAVFCEDRAIGNCKIGLDASSSTSDVIDFYRYNNLDFSQSFNSTTRLYSLIFSTYDGSVVNMGINLTKFDMYANTTLCTNAILTSAGTLTCSVPSSYQNISFTADIYMNNELIGTTIFTINPRTAKDIFGGSSNIVIFVLGFVLSIGVMFIPSGVAVIVGTVLAIIVTSVMFAMSGSILAGGSMIFIVIIALLIIFKMRQGGSD